MLPVSTQLPTLPLAASQCWSMEGLVALYPTDSVLREQDSSPIAQCLSAGGLASCPSPPLGGTRGTEFMPPFSAMASESWFWGRGIGDLPFSFFWVHLYRHIKIWKSPHY